MVRTLHLAVIVHDVRSVHNVGAIFRTADAVGAEKIWLCGITPSPVDRFGHVRQDFSKVALGAEASVPWEKTNTIEEAIAAAKAEGYAVYALEQAPGAVPYHAVAAALAPGVRVALMVGHEVDGISADVLAHADRVIEIPMLGAKESLNVSVAFGIAAFGLRYGGATI